MCVCGRPSKSTTSAKFPTTHTLCLEYFAPRKADARFQETSSCFRGLELGLKNVSFKKLSLPEAPPDTWSRFRLGEIGSTYLSKDTCRRDRSDKLRNAPRARARVSTRIINAARHRARFVGALITRNCEGTIFRRGSRASGIPINSAAIDRH